MSQKLGRPLSQVVIAFQSAATSVGDPAYQREVEAFAARARSFPHTTSATVGVAGKDGRTTYVLVGFHRDPDYMQREMAAFRALLPDQDATVKRLLLVPATMRLLGRWNRWLPGRPVPRRPVGPSRSTVATSGQAETILRRMSRSIR